jgi:hypothetical protein
MYVIKMDDFDSDAELDQIKLRIYEIAKDVTREEFHGYFRQTSDRIAKEFGFEHINNVNAKDEKVT